MEFFVVANSNAAPFCSDTSTHFIEAANAKDALEALEKSYTHPFGLYSAHCFESATDYHKGGKPLAQWLSYFEQAKQAATGKLGCYSFRSERDGFYVDGVFHKADRNGGSVVE